MIKNVTIFFILLLYQICANSETISVVYQIRPPYHTNEKDGILDKILIKIEKLSGMPFSMINIPLQRGLNMIVENKEKICLAANYKNSEREKIAKISIPLYQEKGTVIIFRKDDNNFNEPLKLQNLLMNKKLILLTKVGLSYGKYIDELLKKNNNNVEQSSTDQESMIKKIAYNHSDYMLMTEEEATYLLNNGTRDVINLKKSKLLDVKFGEKRYMICSKKITDFELNKINKAILKINNFKIRE